MSETKLETSNFRDAFINRTTEGTAYICIGDVYVTLTSAGEAALRRWLVENPMPGEAEPVSPEVAAKLVKPTPDQPFPRVTIPAEADDLKQRIAQHWLEHPKKLDAIAQSLGEQAEDWTEHSGDWSQAERPCQYVPIVTARVKLRDDNGPTGELSEPRQYIACPDGQYRELAVVQSAPGLRGEQLEIEA